MMAARFHAPHKYIDALGLSLSERDRARLIGRVARAMQDVMDEFGVGPGHERHDEEEGAEAAVEDEQDDAFTRAVDRGLELRKARIEEGL
jgi:ParB-like chromosome segregation protein Spo0J